MRTTHSPTGQPANRAERRAAARGKPAAEATGANGATGVPAPRTSGPREHTKPVHARADYASRRSG